MLLGFYGGADVEHEITHIFASTDHVPKELISEARKAGRIPLITIEPYKMMNLTHGLWPQYLRNTRGDGAIYVRYGHEFNIPGHYPWSRWGHRKFVREFRAVANTFKHVNPGVRMIWCPNTKYEGSTPIRNWYPGNEYVDVIGIDGYNGTQPDGRWRYPPEIFDPGLHEIAKFSSGKKWWICETASRTRLAEGLEDRDLWLGSLVFLANQWLIDAIVYFNADKERDWRLTESEQRHLRTLVSGGYSAEGKRILDTPPEKQKKVDPRDDAPQLPPHPRGSTFEWLERVTGRGRGSRGRGLLA